MFGSISRATIAENRERIFPIPSSPSPSVPALENRLSHRARTTDRHAQSLRIARGRCLPLGATALADGVNFALLCRHGTAVSPRPVRHGRTTSRWPRSRCTRARNRTGDHWHILVAGLPPASATAGASTARRGRGHRFDPASSCSIPPPPPSPTARVWGETDANRPTGDGTTRRSLFFRRPFDWQRGRAAADAAEDTIIYELHVRGFTCHPSSGVAQPGTFAGLIEKIPYLQELGVTAVELLPIHEFDE